MKELDDFNLLLDQLEGKYGFKAYQASEESEYDKLISFETKVEMLCEFFDKEAEEIVNRATRSLQEQAVDA